MFSNFATSVLVNFWLSGWTFLKSRAWLGSAHARVRPRTAHAHARSTSASCGGPVSPRAQMLRESFSSSTWNGSFAVKSAMFTRFWLLANG